MSNKKKLPRKQLEKFSNIFTQLGLVLVLFVVYLTLEHQTEEKHVVASNDFEHEYVFVDPETEVFFTRKPKELPKIDPPKASPLLLDEPIEKGKNDVIETLIIDEPTENIVEVDMDDIVEVYEPPVIIEDVPFDFIQEAPVFKGCEGLSKEENKICFDKQMKKFVQRNFDIDLASEVGLSSGKYKIRTQFIIDDKGNVTDIKIRAPHVKLKSETQKLIKKLPKFKPGRQNNKFVKVKYNLPISFNVD
ncbi:energy transducer TonB [uncultured Polaribacter sp.]|uniref:energy transducer TonB n=1 Tax=uncultured Polaribacter sp. TaxID=174711 RepID=UPI0026101320|nr:energy transducer TonB [uncultured Polaribacter sp.]